MSGMPGDMNLVKLAVTIDIQCYQHPALPAFFYCQRGIDKMLVNGALEFCS